MLSCPVLHIDPLLFVLVSESVCFTCLVLLLLHDMILRPLHRTHPPLLRIARIRIRTIRFDNRVSLATLPTTNLTTTPHHTPHQHPHTLRCAHHLTSTLGRNLFTLHRLHATSFTRDTYNPFKLAIRARLDSESYTPIPRSDRMTVIQSACFLSISLGDMHHLLDLPFKLGFAPLPSYHHHHHHHHHPTHVLRTLVRLRCPDAALPHPVTLVFSFCGAYDHKQFFFFWLMIFFPFLQHLFFTPRSDIFSLSASSSYRFLIICLRTAPAVDAASVFRSCHIAFKCLLALPVLLPL